MHRKPRHGSAMNGTKDARLTYSKAELGAMLSELCSLNPKYRIRDSTWSMEPLDFDSYSLKIEVDESIQEYTEREDEIADAIVGMANSVAAMMNSRSGVKDHGLEYVAYEDTLEYIRKMHYDSDGIGTSRGLSGMYVMIYLDRKED